MKKLLTDAEVAELFQISRSKLWRMRKEGLPFIRLSGGRIRYQEDELQQWLASHSESQENRGV